MQFKDSVKTLLQLYNPCSDKNRNARNGFGWRQKLSKNKLFALELWKFRYNLNSIFVRPGIQHEQNDEGTNEWPTEEIGERLMEPGANLPCISCCSWNDGISVAQTSHDDAFGARRTVQADQVTLIPFNYAKIMAQRGMRNGWMDALLFLSFWGPSPTLANRSIRLARHWHCRSCSGSAGEYPKAPLDSSRGIIVRKKRGTEIVFLEQCTV